MKSSLEKFSKIGLLTSLFCICILFPVQSQVTIGALTPPKATLDVVATKKDGSTSEGFLAPRLDRAALNNAETAGTYTTDQEGAIVYIIDASTGSQTGQTINVDSKGYYYFDGSVWVHFVGSNVKETMIANDMTTMTLGMPIVMTNAATYAAKDSDYVIVANGTANQTITLPSAVGRKGKVYTVIFLNTGGGSTTTTISTSNKESILFVQSSSLISTPTFSLTPNNQVGATVQSNGANWILLNTAASVKSY